MAISFCLTEAEHVLVDEEGAAAAAEARKNGASEQYITAACELAVEAAMARVNELKFSTVDDINSPAPEVDTNTNGAYMTDLQSAAMVILNHDVFQDIGTLDPLPITANLEKTSGVQSIFDPIQCKMALARESKYICSANFWWQDLFRSATPDVPLRKDRVLELGRHLFHIGAGDKLKRLPHLPGQITIVVASPDADVLGCKGGLVRVSPDEIVHGAVLACADEVVRKVPEARLHRWRDVFLSCCFVFELIRPGRDACYWRSYNLRQTLVAANSGCKRSAKQMAHEIFMYKKLKEAETGTQLHWKQVAAHYRKKGRTALDCESLTKNYINTALTVHEKICAQPALSRCIDQLEQRFGLSSCLSNMTSLHIIACHTEDYSMRKWTMEGIVDSVLAGSLANNDVTKTVLQGSAATGTSLCALLQFRRQVLNRCLSVDLPKLGVHCGDLEVFRVVLADHQSYRTHVCGGLDNRAVVDTTWKARCKQSSILALKFLEDPLRR
jgi:hypothetical protein